MGEVARRRLQKDIESETVSLGCFQQTVFSIRQHLEHVLVVTADGHDTVIPDHDPKWDGDIWNIALRLAVRDPDQDEGVVFIPLDARHFIEIKRIINVISINPPVY